jgi:hypothetical protein
MPAPGTHAQRCWHWLTKNVIDLRKGAAVGTALAATLLALFAFQTGAPHSGPTWSALIGAVLLLPLLWHTWRRLVEEDHQGGRPDLPPLDAPESPEPRSNVRTVD